MGGLMDDFRMKLEFVYEKWTVSNTFVVISTARTLKMY